MNELLKNVYKNPPFSLQSIQLVQRSHICTFNFVWTNPDGPAIQWINLSSVFRGHFQCQARGDYLIQKRSDHYRYKLFQSSLLIITRMKKLVVP
jgi:hypothetical protein